ncbi:cytochrome c oxidase, cbb3-type, CcoQ subunit [Helicobacter sp. MIT 14-3879]|uniref:cytochrome c oxidase, cbb3-type, CcoQ subunit n=1 Tax=Helicobacter sp. MIT 14-3879 TaxID=2040649 RepID=UPI000E1E92B1|nr:cytochrome c oxidase, cbb3-type, CcoQ subunit [Helicobacter sp. MIT 14-3879]RDU65623.1 cytochrome c oxidase, cbb3-type, CcoQ subunit [Helicobacter sp. MIT 14-3879]
MLEIFIEFRGYLYFIATIFLVAFLYSYVYYMYKAQREGTKDYEKYARLALDDSILDTPLEARENKRDGREK